MGNPDATQSTQHGKPDNKWNKNDSQQR
jgi:hypothetical protein